jgi:DNA polymerase-4
LTVAEAFSEGPEMLEMAEGLLNKTAAGERAVRLLGLTVSQFNQDIPVLDPLQLDLPFPE